MTSIADYLMAKMGDRREFGKLMDSMYARTVKEGEDEGQSEQRKK